MTYRALEPRHREFQPLCGLLDLPVCLDALQSDTTINAQTIADKLTRGVNEPSTRSRNHRPTRWQKEVRDAG